MKRLFPLILLATLVVCFLTAVYDASPVETAKTVEDNSYHVFTKSLVIDDSGVGPIPSRFKWSVETCVGGIDLQGNTIPDSRVMLRLYDPDHNFTAITAQMNLKTAEDLQRQLADVIAKKRENPNFQHRPRLYDADQIPTAPLMEIGENVDIDEEGRATLNLQPQHSK